MRSDDPRDPERRNPENRDPSLFDDPADAGDEPREAESGPSKSHALFESDLEGEPESGARELRYEGPITMDGDDEEYEDEGGGGGRLLVTAAIVVGAVIVIVAVAMMMKTGNTSEPGSYPENQATEIAALDDAEPTDSNADLPGSAGASIDYRAIPDSSNEGVPESEPSSTESAPIEAAETLAAAPQSTPTAPPRPRPKPTEARNVVDSAGQSVGDLARSGRVHDAAELGRARLGASSASHTLQVLYSCEPANVEKAFRNVSDPELTVVPAGACYRVCFGAFDSHAAATAAKQRVPSYFAGAGAFPKPLDELSLR
jgi:hypothetical protein